MTREATGMPLAQCLANPIDSLSKRADSLPFHGHHMSPSHPYLL